MSGYYEKVIRVKEDAVPIDNVTKFAWADDDYEEVEVWHENTEEEIRNNKLIEIINLKISLNETDYVVIKIAEGAATREEYADVLAKRQTWRDEINRLEEEMNGNP